MIKKLAVSLGVFAMAFGVFFGSEAYATTYGMAYWRTEDGKYELTLKATSTERNVRVNIWDVYRVNYNNGYATPQDDMSPLTVRLCSASTGNCTAFQSFWYSGYSNMYSSSFTNMIPGTYYVDIRDSWANYYFKGSINAWVEQ